MKTIHTSGLKKYFYLVTTALLLASLPALAQDAPMPNLVANPGFENGAANWSILKDTAQVVNDVAHSGKNSLYYTNVDAKTHTTFTQRLDVRPGQYIKFSVWVKGKGVSTKDSWQRAGIFMQSFEGNKYLSGSYPETSISASGWKRVRGGYSIPLNATRTTLGIYLRKGSASTAWFDDVVAQVEAPASLSSFLIYPNYRGMMTQGDTTPWKFTVDINAQSDWKKGDIDVTNILTNSKGKVLFEKSFQASSKDASVDVTFQPPANLPIGDYSLKQTITTPTGKVGLEKEYAIHVVAKMPKVYIDKEGFTVDDGKRFFPLGIYIVAAADKDLQRISEGGFNTVLSYSYGGGKDPQAYMDRAQKNNLKVIYSVKDMYPGHGSYKEDAFEIAAERLEEVKNKPALLSWYINDELGTEWLPELKKMYNQVKQLDPDHPAFQVLYQMNIIQRYFDVTDVLGADPYPVGSANLTKTASDTRTTVAAARGARGVWMVSQMHDLAVYYKDRKQHRPTLTEMRNQAYQDIINGAKGLIWYSYFDLKYEKYPRDESTENVALFNKRWKDASSLAHEIDAIIPAILHGDRIALDLPADSKVEAGALQYKNQLLLMLANPYYQEEKVTLTLPQGWKIKDADQGEIKSTFADGKVTFILPSVGSGVFRLEKTN